MNLDMSLLMNREFLMVKELKNIYIIKLGK